MGINLGEDVASASLQVGGNLMEKFFDLLKLLLATGKEASSKVAKDKSMSTKIGRNNLKRLIKAKEDLVPLSQSLTKEQMKLWSYYAKKYGIVYSVAGDKMNNEKIIIIRKADLERAVSVSEKVVEATKLKEFAKKNKDNTEFTDKVIDGYMQDLYQEMNMKGVSFNEALNRITDRDFSRDKPYFMVERNNPENFIMLNSYLDTFRGKEYTATDYTIYKDGNKIGSFSDKRFEGRDKYFWTNLKKEMKSMGDFSDDVVVLNSQEELDNYRASFKKHVAERSKKDINFNLDLSQVGIEDYEGLIKGLKERSKIDFIQDITTGAMTPISESEKRNIDKQIRNYEKIDKLQASIEFTKSQYVMNVKRLEANPTDAKIMDLQNELIEQLNEYKIKMDDLLKIEEDLKHEEGMIITNDILSHLYREEVAKRYNENDITLNKKIKELGMDEETMLSRAGDLLDDSTKRGIMDRMQEIKHYRMNLGYDKGISDRSQSKHLTSGKSAVISDTER